jgi:inner membrane protein
MDNITHTLLGALVGETVARCLPATRSLLPETQRRSLFVSLMVVGSNVPDLDSLYAGITGGKLGYLLHHRGHTHTVLGALLLAFLTYALWLWWMQRRRLPHSAYDRRWLAFTALLAPLLHIMLDATNEYGVHPFWPLNNDWFYGDSIFIVEPLFWAAGAPLVFLLQHRAARAVVGLVLLVGVALSFGTGLLPLAPALALTLLTFTLLLIGWKCSARLAAVAGLCAACAVIAVFTVTARLARNEVQSLAAAQYPQALALDYVLAPMPVNPLCWDVIALQLQGDAYTLRQAVLSLAPGWIAADACPGPGLGAQTTVTLNPSTAPDSGKLQWLDEATMSRREAQQLLSGNCEARAFAGFARALWFRRNEGGWLVGDLRYDREEGLGFAEMQVNAAPQRCPRFVPPWTAPRSDLLRPGLNR